MRTPVPASHLSHHNQRTWVHSSLARGSTNDGLAVAPLPRDRRRRRSPFPSEMRLIPGRNARTTAPESDDGELTGSHRHGVLPTMTDTCVRLWRRVHMDLVRYAGCVCRPSC
ncbi:putative leader peptide [Streptomyces sp. cf386]|uniref:putative leader peptide n=1 Tax=Streptomyces sp. cf386 TaxID=1761904 RepID=UPI003523C05D